MPVVRVEVSGAVQGVGFRWFTREAARRHGLAGWVKNRENGTVEIAASGTSESLERFLAEVRRGPAGAYVERLRYLPADALHALEHPFSIVR
jgi:acylphosphatase